MIKITLNVENLLCRLFMRGKDTAVIAFVVHPSMRAKAAPE